MLPVGTDGYSTAIAQLLNIHSAENVSPVEALKMEILRCIIYMSTLEKKGYLDVGSRHPTCALTNMG